MQKKTHNRIKVLICINNLYVGGAQRQLQRQLPYFDTEAFDISVLSYVIDSKRIEINIRFPNGVSCFKIQMNSLLDIVGWYKSFKIVKQIKPDVIMSSMFWSNTIARVVGLLNGVPVIARYHNTVPYNSMAHKFIDVILARFTHTFVGVSSEVSNYIIKQIPAVKGRMEVITNGIDLLSITRDISERSRIRMQLGIMPEELLMVTVARLVPQKDQSLMLEGLVKIRFKYPEVKLCIVGEGGLRQVLEHKAKELGIAGAVFFVGHQDNVYPYYEAADIYISTSLIEGMSNTQLEALAHGLPILATETGGTIELINEGENGFIIKERTAEAMLEAFEKYHDHDSELLRRAALDKVSHFDIRKTVKRYEALWRRVGR